MCVCGKDREEGGRQTLDKQTNKYENAKCYVFFTSFEENITR